MVFDLDREDAVLFGEDLADWRVVPTPNIIVGNPKNGHAHYWYALATPVCTSPVGLPKPQMYAKAIYEALAARLGADPRFVQLVAKNPLHQSHDTQWLQAEPYSLQELGEYMDANLGKAWRESRRQVISTTGDSGRNCALFDALRTWAYEAVHPYIDAGDRRQWISACVQQAITLNSFPHHHKGDLPLGEVRATARSVGGCVWNWRQAGRLSSRDFSIRQRQRGRRKGQQKRHSQMPEAIRLAHEGYSQRAIAESLNVSQKTVCNWLRRDRAVE